MWRQNRGRAGQNGRGNVYPSFARFLNAAKGQAEIPLLWLTAHDTRAYQLDCFAQPRTPFHAAGI